MDGYNNWHWTIQYPILITTLLLLLKNTNNRVKAVNLAVLAVFGISICILSKNAVNVHVNADLATGADDQVLAARYLESENIGQGISMAWSAQKIEELTNGKVEMYVVDSYSYGYLPSHWLQKVSHLSPPPSGTRCAVVMADLETGGMECETDIVKYGKYISEKEFGTIHVYIFESFDEIQKAFDIANSQR